MVRTKSSRLMNLISEPLAALPRITARREGSAVALSTCAPQLPEEAVLAGHSVIEFGNLRAF